MSSAHSLLRQTIPNTHFPSPTARSPPPAPRCSPLPGLSHGTGPAVLLALGGGYEPTMSLPSFAPQSRARHGVFFQAFFYSSTPCISGRGWGPGLCLGGSPPEHGAQRASSEPREEGGITYPSALYFPAQQPWHPLLLCWQLSAQRPAQAHPLTAPPTSPTPSDPVSATSFVPSIRPPWHQTLHLAPATSPKME